MCNHDDMDTGKLEHAAHRYREAEAALDAARADLQSEAVTFLRQTSERGAQTVAANITGWSREHLRGLRKKADEEDERARREAEMEELRRKVEELSADNKPQAAAAVPRTQVTQTIPERKRPPKGWRGTPLQIRNLADLARGRADSGQLAHLDQAANAEPEEGKQDHAVLREAYDMGVLTDDDLYAEQPDTTEEQTP